MDFITTQMFSIMIFSIISCIVSVNGNHDTGASGNHADHNEKAARKEAVPFQELLFRRDSDAIVDYFGDDPAAMKQAGIAYATDQIIDLIANGVRNIHVYSMNKPEVAAAIMQNLSEIVK